MSRPTPETDAIASIEGNWDTKALRMTAHSRKLEQERDEAREERDKLQVMRKEVVAANKGAKINAQVSNSLAGKLNQAERERDEARDEINIIRNTLDSFERERDEARKETEYSRMAAK